jgi:hypothetical protein
MAAEIPAWCDLSISNHAKYLGIFMGPTAGSVQWLAPIAKFKQRCEKIYCDRMPRWIACREYTSKAMSVLLYVGQLCLPPRGFNALEAQSINKVLGFATNALTHDACFSLDYLGGLKMPRPSFALAASRFRAGCKTLRDCDTLLAKLICTYIYIYNWMAFDFRSLLRRGRTPLDFFSANIVLMDCVVMCFVTFNMCSGYLVNNETIQ